MTINICATDSNAANEIFNGSILTLSCAGEGEGFIFFSKNYVFTVDLSRFSMVVSLLLYTKYEAQVNE